MLLELRPILFLGGQVAKQVYPSDHLAGGVTEPVGRNGDVHDSASNSNANSNSNGDAHAAAYPDAETGSDADAAPDSHAIGLAAADATLIRIIQAGTREQNSRVLMTSLATNGASGRRLINVRPFPWGIDQTGHAHGDVRKIVLTDFCGFRYKSVLLSECREINPCR